MTPRSVSASLLSLSAAALLGLAALALAVALSSASPVLAQGEADPVLRDFVPIGDFDVLIDGQADSAAKVFSSRSAGALMVQSPSLEAPMIVSPRTGSVSSVSFMNLAVRPTGSIDVLAEAQLIPVGAFDFGEGGITFTAGGRTVLLREKPPLLGLQERSDLLSYNPAYGRTAEDYTPDPSALPVLESFDYEVRVVVYFGSWCDFCKRFVPRLLKVEDELNNPNIDIDYYGLPQGFTDEPEAKKNGITGVPTGIVYVRGKEVGRLERGQWSNPDRALQFVLTGR